MKKRFLAVITMIAVISALISCANEPGKIDEATRPDSTEKPKTETVANTETQPNTSTENTIENPTVSLNMDLFGEYEMTYAELKEKHGKMIGYEQFDGGSWYLLENGYGYYWFGKGIDPNRFITDPEAGFEYQSLDDEEICRGVRNISPEFLFNEPFETLSIKTISDIEGIDLVSTNPDGIVTPRACASTFTYSGWNNDKVEITIYHENENMIDLTSEARICIHPQDIRAEES